jgi:two-component system alkaline phosphatase synthesis response regulator PhoP
LSDRLLLVEDDPAIGEIVALNLQRAGFHVRWVQTGAGAITALSEESYDALLLDLMLPDMSGYDIARHARREIPSLPLLMLTARSDTASKIKGFEAGADDYLAKPFELEELMMRVRALVRRGRADRHLPAESVYRFPNGFWVNFETFKAAGSDGEVLLKEKEAGILQTLIRRQGEIVTRSEILEEVWGMDVFPTERTVDNFIVNLRRHFENDPANPRHIHSVRGRGYRFEP